MKILVLASWYPDRINPINGIFIKEQVRALKQVGIIPIVFYPYDKSIKKGKCEKFIEEGIYIYRANTDYLKNTKISKIFSIAKSIKLLNKLVRKNNVDLVHCQVCYTAGFIACIYNKFFNKIPYVITEHSSKVEEFSNKRYNKFLFYRSYKNAKYVITVSKYLALELYKLNFKMKNKVIGNVVDTSSYNINISSKNNTTNKWNIIFIGLMVESEVKGLQYFIPALSNFMMNNLNYDITFNIVGDGPKRQKYESMCKKLGIYNKCKFYGKVDKSLIPNFIEKNDFLVLPSVKETFGSVLVEAMAGGKPVLATKCGGPEDFVNEKVGILVEPKSKKALEDGLKYIFDNYNNFNPEYIRQYAENNFNYESIGIRLKKLYSEILDN